MVILYVFILISTSSLHLSMAFAFVLQDCHIALVIFPVKLCIFVISKSSKLSVLLLITLLILFSLFYVYN